ncbi:ISL3 family transposase [Compostibacillus humi]|uniref:ISL3 family transposase n=1 Tax=Compostibacillus humi TaxID=1245525 RepID=A0A8J2TMK1_9BACI|nr:ISL3 family transposase [Compostibacillus humi]GFZ81818.1 ISL3 family transposase [Compostibacillus humi]
MNNTIKIPGLEDVIITKVEEFEDRIAIFVEMKVQTHRCPKCGKKTRKIHDYRVQKIKHLKWFERLSYIFYRKRRYRCDACGKRFYEKNTIVDRYQRFSKEWNRAVNIRSVRAKTFKEISQQFGASPSTIIRRFDELAEKELKDVEELPRVISIDEYKGDTKEGKYQVIIANGETKEPIDILPNRRKKTIANYLRKYGAKVGVVVMDMSPSFKAAVNKALDRPVIVADRFHFCRYIYWALDAVRRRVQSTWNDYDRKKCKKMRYVFYKDSGKLSDKDRWYLNRYCQMSEELRAAYQLKEKYCKWFQQAKQNGLEKIQETKKGLYRFYELVEESGIPEFKRNIQTLKNWQTEILNSFVYGYSNGFLEGINNHTKVMKRNAFGFRNFRRSRARILLSHKYKEIGVHVG